MINIIIINLADEKEKRLRALERIKALNLPQNAAGKGAAGAGGGGQPCVWVLNAIVPQTIPQSWASKEVKFKKRLLRPEEIACAASHILALKAAANAGKSRLFKQNYPLLNPKTPSALKARPDLEFVALFPAFLWPISLICEDDVKFAPSAGQIIAQIAAQKPASWASALLLLGHHLQLYADDGYCIATPLRRRSKREFAGHFWAKHAGMSVGAYAYMLRAPAAKCLLASALPICRPADWLTHQSPLALCAAPALAGCEHESSSTNPGLAKRKISLLRKRFKRVKFFFQYFWRVNF